MDYWSALEVLGLEDEDELNREQVRRTYMRRLREHPPERDPEGFRVLREAYEAVRHIVPDAPRVAKEEAAKIVVVDAPPVEEKPEPSYSVVREEREHDPGSTYSLTGDRIPERTHGSTYSRTAYSYKGEELHADKYDDDDDDLDDEQSAGGANAADDDDFDDEDFDEEQNAGDANAADDEDFDDGQNADDANAEEKANGVDEDELDEDRADDDDESADDDDESADADREHVPPDLDELGRPTMSLSTLVDKLLVLLEHDEVDEALALERTWREHGDTDDHRQANQYVALKWALTRELLGVVGNLPAPIVRALARGIDGSDFAPVRPDLERYRHTNPHQAEDANVVLATRANDIYQQIKGTLYVAPPPRPQPQYFQQPPQVTTSKSSFSGVWVGLAAMLILFRVLARGDCGSSTSSSRFNVDIPDIKIEPYRFKPHDIDYAKLSELSSRLSQPKPFDPAAERWELIYEINDALSRLKTYEYNLEQRARIDELSKHIDADNCPKIRSALKAIEAESSDPMPSKTAYVQGIRKRVDIVCPPPKAKAKPKKKKKSDE